jgi:hypothetical protein
MSRWLALLILSGVVGVWFGSSISAADDTPQHIQELQKKLNAEVLSQPFSVPDIKQVRPQKTEAETRQAKPRQYIHPRRHGYPLYLGLRWHGHHSRHRYGYHHHRYYRHY